MSGGIWVSMDGYGSLCVLWVSIDRYGRLQVSMSVWGIYVCGYVYGYI